MNQLARAIMACAQASGPPPFSYDDIPNQLLRINSLEGSLAFSGAVLTGVTDVSPAGETVTVTGSPTYTAANANLNNAPSFTSTLSSSIKALNVNRASIRFCATVIHRPSAGNQLVIDGTSASNRYFINLAASNALEHSSGTIAGLAPGSGRYRLLVPNDNATAVKVNGSNSSNLPVGSSSGSGVTLGARYDGTITGAQIAFQMLCSAVPSAPLLTSLEAKLLADFG